MAKPYKEGKGWAYRLRVVGEDIYRAGFKSEALARVHMEKVKVELTEWPAQSHSARVWVLRSTTTHASGCPTSKVPSKTPGASMARHHVR